MQELQILLELEKKLKNVFHEVPIVGFQNGKSLKDYLVRAALSKMDNAGSSETGGKGTSGIFQVCDDIITTNSFTTKACGKVSKIEIVPLNCSSLTVKSSLLSEMQNL